MPIRKSVFMFHPFHVRTKVVGSLLFAMAAIFLICRTGFAVQIAIENHKADSTIRYPVVLLRGTAQGDFAKPKIVNLNPRDRADPVRPVLHNGKFKALVELSAGENIIRFSGTKGKGFDFRIHYLPQTNPYYVRVIWMTAKNGDTSFATPDERMPQEYEARLRTAAELMQSFTAERMHELGLGRKTFRLERNKLGQVIVHTLKAPQTAQHYYEMNDQSWWRSVYRWLNTRYPDVKAKNMVLAAFTRKDPKSGKMKAHTALGGGNLGLFGSASVFSWPRSIQSAAKVFQDANRFDSSRVHDDSAGRSTIWGLASTTMGATLHEMGHTFGLMHVRDNRGIMSRGFDYFNRAFTFHDPPSGRNRKAVYFDREQEARFARISGTMLQWSNWFQMDKPTTTKHKRPTIRFDADRKSFEIQSEAGIGWVGFMTGAHDVTAFMEFTQQPLPKTITMTAAEIRKKMENATLVRITTIDAAGRISGFNVPGKKN